MFGANPFGSAYLGQAYPVPAVAIGAPFIPSTTTVYIPIVRNAGEIDVDFIASSTVVYAPSGGGVANASYARVSQLALEVLDGAAGNVLVSQEAIEVLKQRPVTTFVGVSQVAVEVLVPVARRARFWAQIV